MKKIFSTHLFRVLLAWMLSWGEVGATSLEFDLNDGAFFGTPGIDFHYFSNAIDLSSPITVDQNNPAEIWIEFVDKNTSAKQHLEVFDEFTVTTEQIAVGLIGNVSETDPFFSVELSGVSGDFVGNPLTTMGGDCDPGNGCFSFGLPPGGDLTATSFFFHDLHINMSVGDGAIPFEVDRLNFLVFADRFEQGTWEAVPVPAALPLLLSGIAGLSLIGRRQRNKI